MQTIHIDFQDEDTKIKIQNEKPLAIDMRDGVSIAAPMYHRDLQGLDFESSGHTGFASEKQISILLPKDISILPKNDLQNRDSKIYLYDSSKQNKETQISVSEFLDSKIKTVDSVPNNLQQSDYIFLEIKK